MTFPRIAFGLDIAGLSGNDNAGLAALSRAGHDASHIDVWIVSDNVFGVGHDGHERLLDVEQRQVQSLRQMGELGNIYVDTMLDTQDLDTPSKAEWVWQLNLRPVDCAYAAMSIYAQNIGAPYARMRRLGLNNDTPRLGKQLWETYPRASLMEMGLHFTKYKDGNLAFEIPIGGTGWTNRELESDRKELDAIITGLEKQKGNKKRGAEIKKAKTETVKIAKKIKWIPKQTRAIEIAEKLRLTPADSDLSISGDQLDAIICAIPGVIARDQCLQGAELRNTIRDRIRGIIQKKNKRRSKAKQLSSYDGPCDPPPSYVLAKSYTGLPEMKVRVICHEEFVKMLAKPDLFYREP